MATLTIDDDAYAELARLAERRGMTAEEWLNRTYAAKSAAPPAPQPSGEPALEQSPGESAFEAWQRVGAIGCVTGGPDDLATNPKYMRDFGRS